MIRQAAPTRREILAAALGVGTVTIVPRIAASAQTKSFYAPVATGEDRGPPIALGRVSTRQVFRAPEGFPNALCPAPEGLWVAEQRFDGVPERLWLMDWQGNVRRTISSAAKDTSGVALGNDKLWICADDVDNPGVFVTSLNGELLQQRQIPLGPPVKAGGCHGATWHDDHLWVTANRPRAILKINTDTWTVDYLIPFGLPEGLTRYHGCAAIGNSMFMVSGNESNSYRVAGGTHLIEYAIDTGTIVKIWEFAPGSCDPHGLMAHDGQLFGCDSGFHPGWAKSYEIPGLGKRTSPTAGWIFSIHFS